MTHQEKESSGADRKTRPQQMMACVQALLNDPKKETDVRKALTDAANESRFQQLEGLVMRSGLLQVALYVARKQNDAAGDKEAPLTKPYALLSEVLHGIEPKLPARTGQDELFATRRPKGAGSLAWLDPRALATLPRVEYQRLTQDLLQLCELLSGYAAAQNILIKGEEHNAAAK